MTLQERADRWVHCKYTIPDAVAQADTIIQELLIELEEHKNAFGRLQGSLGACEHIRLKQQIENLQESQAYAENEYLKSAAESKRLRIALVKSADYIANGCHIIQAMAVIKEALAE